MSRGPKTLAAALASVPAVAFQRKLARVVTLEGLGTIDPHDWLYSTGRSYRYNLAGADCVYFSETREVAQMEYDSYWHGLAREFQPVATYHAEVSLSRVLDLTDPPLSHLRGGLSWQPLLPSKQRHKARNSEMMVGRQCFL